ncbi:MAG: hypothetical protein ABL986_09630 [Vicinamibacterales bacterium]
MRTPTPLMVLVALGFTLSLACSSSTEQPAATETNQATEQQARIWELRTDESQNASDPDNTSEVDFTANGTSGFRYAGGPAGTLWVPGQTASGVYTLSGTFTLNTPSSHPNYYGLVFAGSSLGEAAQRYLYFTIAQDGTYLIKVRDGDDTRELEGGQMMSPAIQRPQGNASAVNTLEVRVTTDAVAYVINDTVVHSSPRTGAFAATDGIVGARVNHVTDVTLTNFTVK